MFGNISVSGLLIILVMAFLMAFPAIRIAKRAGFGNGWVGVLYAIPMVNIVVLWVFAFVDWPIETEKDQ